MRVYLVQHGPAMTEEQNPDRPLSEKGRAEVERVASFLRRSCPPIPRIIHSPKARARDTALVLARVLGLGEMVEEAADGLGPMDSTDLLAQSIGQAEGDLMAVGHQPFMGRMVARLTSGAEGAGFTGFEPGTVVCLEKVDGPWNMVWMIRPDLLG